MIAASHAESSESRFSECSDYATEMGANAIIGCRYDATEVVEGVTEVLCYGTAVVVDKIV